MSQKIQDISVEDLVLWTENPRDPIDPHSIDQDVVDRALDDIQSKWTLAKLATEMGEDFDFSEIPTVVYKEGRPVVYDGNRRVILAKVKHGFVHVPEADELQIGEIPKKLPCNVCSEPVALRHILRKHGKTGSWAPLDRDTFVYKYLGQPKSLFMILEEHTGLISSRPDLNKGFVRDEIFTPERMKSLGFAVQGDKLLSTHSKKDAEAILSDIAKKVEDKKTDTRTNRRQILKVLEPSVQAIINKNKGKRFKGITALKIKGTTPKKTVKQQSRRVAVPTPGLFGGPLYLKTGETNNLYKDIADLYSYYTAHKAELSQTFPTLIRMSLRLLCETAAVSKGKNMGDFVKSNFDVAKGTLDQNEKTTLSNQNVKKESIEQLLHTGAHNYKAASNLDQTIALSWIVGAILTVTHGK